MEKNQDPEHRPSSSGNGQVTKYFPVTIPGFALPNYAATSTAVKYMALGSDQPVSTPGPATEQGTDAS